MTRRQIHQARVELEWLRSRYDHGAISDAIYQTVKRIETDIAWHEHREEQKS